SFPKTDASKRAQEQQARAEQSNATARGGSANDSARTAVVTLCSGRLAAAHAGSVESAVGDRGARRTAGTHGRRGRRRRRTRRRPTHGGRARARAAERLAARARRLRATGARGCAASGGGDTA